MERIIEEVLSAYKEVFNRPGTVFDEEPSPEDILRLIHEESLEVMFMKDAKVFCFFRRRDIYTYVIEYLGVRENFQGKGLGGRLLHKVMELCYGTDPLIKQILLLCPDDRVTFYERHGFVLSGKETDGGRCWNKMIRLTKNVHQKPGIFFLQEEQDRLLCN